MFDGRIQDPIAYIVVVGDVRWMIARWHTRCINLQCESEVMRTFERAGGFRFLKGILGK